MTDEPTTTIVQTWNVQEWEPSNEEAHRFKREGWMPMGLTHHDRGLALDAFRFWRENHPGRVHRVVETTVKTQIITQEGDQ